MTYEQFWNDDVNLVKFYRKADEIKNKKKNQELWLQGAYFHNALNACVGNLFAKKGAALIQYLDEPFPLTQKEFIQRKEKEEKERMEKMQVMFNAYTQGINNKFKEAQSGTNS